MLSDDSPHTPSLRVVLLVEVRPVAARTLMVVTLFQSLRERVVSSSHIHASLLLLSLSLSSSHSLHFLFIYFQLSLVCSAIHL